MENFLMTKQSADTHTLRMVSAAPGHSPYHSGIVRKVMPLHQIIHYANQAAAKNQPVLIQLERQLPNKKYIRQVHKGIFRTGLNQNRQIIFQSCSDNLTYLLDIDHILSITRCPT